MQQMKFLINIKYYNSVILVLIVKFYQDTFYQTYTGNNLLQKFYLLYSDEKFRLLEC